MRASAASDRWRQHSSQFADPGCEINLREIKALIRIGVTLNGG
jgi:hypothetical protein